MFLSLSKIVQSRTLLLARRQFACLVPSTMSTEPSDHTSPMHSYSLPVTIMQRTIVFTLPRGTKVFPKDFEPALNIVPGKLVAFGTVGVGHVWHAILIDMESVHLLLDLGSFCIKGKEVMVSQLSTLSHTAFLYWLPFWVPNNVVEDCLESALGDVVDSEYVRMSQPGVQDCYSTQRKLTSAVSLSSLPYYLSVRYEGSLIESVFLSLVDNLFVSSVARLVT